MNDFGFIDYKRPMPLKDDFRTSTYLGHKYMTDTKMGNKMYAKYQDKKHYNEDPQLAKTRVSDYRSNYVWNYGDPDELRNPTLNQTLFIKSFEECNLRFIKRPIRPAVSVSHSDYLWRPTQPCDVPTPIFVPEEVKTTKISINRAKPGHTKYLDPNATTQRLDYCAYTPQEIMRGVGAHDNITFWNWDKLENSSKRVFREKDEQLCDKLPASQCPKRRCEFPSLVKHVPHTGLTTEVRENYVEPIKRTIEFDTTDIHNNLVYYPAEPPTTSEYTLYGSGEKTQKYV